MRVTSEDERQKVLNFFRPITERVKIRGLPTPSQPAKETALALKSTENDAEGDDNTSSHKGEKSGDIPHDAKAEKTEGQRIEGTCDGAVLAAHRNCPKKMMI